MGGLLQLLGGFLEFFIGNTFSFVVFSAFGQSFPTTKPRRILQQIFCAKGEMVPY